MKCHIIRAFALIKSYSCLYFNFDLRHQTFLIWENFLDPFKRPARNVFARGFKFSAATRITSPTARFLLGNSHFDDSATMEGTPLSIFFKRCQTSTEFDATYAERTHFPFEKHMLAWASHIQATEGDLA